MHQRHATGVFSKSTFENSRNTGSDNTTGGVTRKASKTKNAARAPVKRYREKA